MTILCLSKKVIELIEYNTVFYYYIRGYDFKLCTKRFYMNRQQVHIYIDTFRVKISFD